MPTQSDDCMFRPGWRSALRQASNYRCKFHAIMQAQPQTRGPWGRAAAPAWAPWSPAWRQRRAALAGQLTRPRPPCPAQTGVRRVRVRVGVGVGVGVRDRFKISGDLVVPARSRLPLAALSLIVRLGSSLLFGLPPLRGSAAPLGASGMLVLGNRVAPSRQEPQP